MDWTQGIPTAATMIFTFLILAYFNKDTKKPLSRNEEGKFVLRLNRAYQISAFIFFAIAISALASAVLIEEEGLYLICTPFILIFGFLGWSLYATYLNHEVVFDENLISITNWKGITETITWEQIHKISYSRNWGYVYLHVEGQKLKIVQYVIGLIVFVQLMEQRTEWRAKEMGLHL